MTAVLSPTNTDSNTYTNTTGANAVATEDPTARLMRIAAVVGPLFFVASSVAWLGEDREELRGILTFWALPFMALAVYGVAGRLQERSPMGRALVTALVTIGACAGAGFATEVSMVEHFGVERLMDQDTPSAFLGLGIPGPMFPLGLVLLALLSFRHRTMPRGQALLLAAGGLLFPVSRIPQVAPLALAADLLILAAFAPVAFGVRRGNGTVA